MARIRSIKPSFWGSQEAANMSRDARLLTLGLVSHADDDGRFLGSIASINGAVFPNDDLHPAKVRGRRGGKAHERMIESVEELLSDRGDGRGLGAGAKQDRHQFRVAQTVRAQGGKAFARTIVRRRVAHQQAHPESVRWAGYRSIPG